MDTWFPTFRKLATGGTPFTLWWPWWTTAAQQRALLRLIAVANEEKLPLGPLLAEWADDERGVQRFRLRRLVKLLADGRSLPDAAEAVPGVLRDEDILALRFDNQSGTRTAAVRASLGESPSASAEPLLRFLPALFYFATVLSIGLFLILFVQITIMPKLELIFSEFGMQQPALVAWSMRPSASGIGLLVLVGVILLLLSIWLFATQAGRRIRRSLGGRLFRSVHEFRSAEVLQQLGVAVSAGRPIPSAVSTLARYHFDPRIRHSLLVVRNEMEQGMPVWQSLAEVGIVSPPEANLLRIAEQQGSPAWALQQLVGVKKQRVSRRLERAGEFLLPAFVLLLSLLVIFQACSVFVPLLKLLEGLL